MIVTEGIGCVAVMCKGRMKPNQIPQVLLCVQILAKTIHVKKKKRDEIE